MSHIEDSSASLALYRSLSAREVAGFSTKEAGQFDLAQTYDISPGKISGLGTRSDGNLRFTLNTLIAPDFDRAYNGEVGGPHLIALGESMGEVFHLLRDGDKVTAGDLTLMLGSIFREAVLMSTYGDFQPELPVGVTFGFGKTAPFNRPGKGVVLETGVWMPPYPDEIAPKGVVLVHIDQVYRGEPIYVEAPYDLTPKVA